MNTRLSPLWTHLSSEGRLTGTWRSALPLHQDRPSPCHGACPVAGRIAEWIAQVGAGDLHGAWVTLTDNNPFPAIAGRICHHPCESACNRQFLDETVGICNLERHVGDAALAAGWRFAPPAAERDIGVAIVGGGPAGLSAAYQLRRQGIRVSLHEAQDRLGGLMRYGIPSYRLERAVLDAEIARILDLGIDLHLGAAPVDRAALERLRERHDAVLLATGASLPRRLATLDYGQPWVIDSAGFLALPRAGQRDRAGARVAVIGGGSAAMDVARTARRLGAAVTVIALEPEAAMPAQRIEVDEARDEGVVLVCGARLEAAEARPDGIGLRCIAVDFHPGARPGDFRVEPRAGTGFEIVVDTIVPAIGQDADLARWAGLAAGDGAVIACTADHQTSTPGIYAGGDVASLARFVTSAIGMGKDAARAMAAALGRGPQRRDTDATAAVGFDRIATAYQDRRGREREQPRPAAARLADFDPAHVPLSGSQARAEAARCFSCGTCTHCDNCYFYCPDMAIARTGTGYAVNADYCKGCGLCVAECPTGAIHLQEGMRR